MIDGYMRVFYNDKNIILVIYAIIFISLYLILGYWGDKIILTDKYYKNINLQYYDLYNFKEKYNGAYSHEYYFTRDDFNKMSLYDGIQVGTKYYVRKIEAAINNYSFTTILAKYFILKYFAYKNGLKPKITNGAIFMQDLPMEPQERFDFGISVYFDLYVHKDKSNIFEEMNQVIKKLNNKGYNITIITVPSLVEFDEGKKKLVKRIIKTYNENSERKRIVKNLKSNIARIYKTKKYFRLKREQIEISHYEMNKSFVSEDFIDKYHFNHKKYNKIVDFVIESLNKILKYRRSHAI